jgi:hypothetical protein
MIYFGSTATVIFKRVRSASPNKSVRKARKLDGSIRYQCVCASARFAFGNAHRNNLIGPGQNVFDGSARKEFHVTETQRLEFRAEFFNFFNHPNFAQPDNFMDDSPGVAG